VLRDRPGLEVLDAAQVLPDVPAASRGRYLQLWPHRHGTDAMFGAYLRRHR
jgi:16S rRNA (cytosine967-C5)-methyltransferase